MEQCRDCRFFDNTVQNQRATDAESTGRCRVHEPAIAQNGEPSWPFCRITDWCGHFEAAVP